MKRILYFVIRILFYSISIALILLLWLARNNVSTTTETTSSEPAWTKECTEVRTGYEKIFRYQMENGVKLDIPIGYMTRTFIRSSKDLPEGDEAPTWCYKSYQDRILIKENDSLIITMTQELEPFSLSTKKVFYGHADQYVKWVLIKNIPTQEAIDNIQSLKDNFWQQIDFIELLGKNSLWSLGYKMYKNKISSDTDLLKQIYFLKENKTGIDYMIVELKRDTPKGEFVLDNSISIFSKRYGLNMDFDKLDLPLEAIPEHLDSVWKFIENMMVNEQLEFDYSQTIENKSN